MQSLLDKMENLWIIINGCDSGDEDKSDNEDTVEQAMIPIMRGANRVKRDLSRLRAAGSTYKSHPPGGDNGKNGDGRALAARDHLERENRW